MERPDTQQGMTRRQVVGRAAALGAVAWSAPTLLTSTAYAAGTAVLICPPGQSAGTGDKPNVMTYQWNPNVWTWDTCTVGGVQSDGRDSNTPPSCVGGTLTIKAFGSPYNPPSGIPAVQVSGGGQFTLTNLQGGRTSGQPNNNLTMYFLCNSSVTPAALDGMTESQVAALSGVRRVTVHISCSQSLCLNDMHGWFELKAASSVNNP